MNIRSILARALLVAVLGGSIGAIFYLPSFSFTGKAASRHAEKRYCEQKNEFIRYLAESNE